MLTVTQKNMTEIIYDHVKFKTNKRCLQLWYIPMLTEGKNSCKKKENSLKSSNEVKK